MKDTLAAHLAEGKDWARIETDLEGVNVVKMPAKGGYAERLSVEINPTGKRHAIFVRNLEELEQLAEVFADERVTSLVKMVGSINPEQKKAGILKI